MRFLAQPAPTVGLMTLQVIVASLREDIDAILKSRVPEFEAPSTDPTEDTVMGALFIHDQFFMATGPSLPLLHCC